MQRLVTVSKTICSSQQFNAARTAVSANCGLAARSPITQQKRDLSIHEYQSQALMRHHGVNVAKGRVAHTAEEAKDIAEGFRKDGIEDYVIKAQILAGGRGLGKFDTGLEGGVHICSSPKEIQDYASKMIGHKLITKQTGEEGRQVDKVFIVERKYLRREVYFALLMDRSFNGPVMVGSSKGGMDIEAVARDTPDAIHKEPIDIEVGITDDACKRMAKAMGFSEKTQDEAIEQMKNLYALFEKNDATMVEVNPMAETPDGHVLAMDAKINFDDNAEFRQSEIFGMRDRTQEDKQEVEASKHDLNFINLDGNIGCLVNGAGLAMATMDIIKLHGGSPANFLDVGGGATSDQVTEAFKLLSNDPKVRAIFVNIFGGIMRCDVIAAGIINACQQLSLSRPLIVRLQGTNIDEARQLLQESGLRIIFTPDLDDAAQKAVRCANIVDMAAEMKLGVDFMIPM